MAMRPRVFVTQQHPGHAVDRLREHADVDAFTGDELPHEELIARLEGKDAVLSVVPDRLRADVIGKFPNLKLIANVAVGYDNIDIGAASNQGIAVVNTPGVLDDTTADLAFALMLATARRLVEADSFVRTDKWRQFSPDLLQGMDVHHKTIGIVGLGRIGRAMARRARGFGMEVLYSQRNRAPEHAAEFAAEYVSLDELLKRSDFVSIHCPLSASTRHLIGAAQFSLMQKHAILINTGRGPIIDERALIEALQTGTIAGAGLDVFEGEPDVPGELIAMTNVVLAPHIGSATHATRAAMADLAVDGLIKAFAGEKPHNLVNPQIWEQFLQRHDLSASKN